jgi:hypothetical protein
VNIELRDSCEIYELRNKQIIDSETEFMAENLIYFIHVIYGFRIKQIVIDFIKDKNGKNWVTDVKHFKWDEFDKVRYLRLKNVPLAIRSSENEDFNESKL